MNSSIYKFVLVSLVSISCASAVASNPRQRSQTITGQQCKALLNPIVEQVDSSSYIQTHNEINNHIPNVRGTSLETIASHESQVSVVQNFVNLVRRAIRLCPTTCEGLPANTTSNNPNSSNTFPCSALPNINPLGVRASVGMIDDDATAEVAGTTADSENGASNQEVAEDLPQAVCSFNPNDGQCQNSDSEINPTPSSTARRVAELAVEMMEALLTRQHQEAQEETQTNQRQGLRTNGFEYYINTTVSEEVEVEI